MKQQTNNPTSPSAQDLLNEADAKHWLDLIGRLNDPVVDLAPGNRLPC